MTLLPELEEEHLFCVAHWLISGTTWRLPVTVYRLAALALALPVQ